MPSFEHNGWVQLLRMHPNLVSRLLRERCGVAVPPGTQVQVGDTTLAKLTPVQVQADLVIEYRDAAGVLQMVAIVEVQRKVDDEKRWSWPAYLALVRLQWRCEVCVIVLTPSQRVARWARRVARSGPGNGWIFVVGPEELPPIVDPKAVATDPALAVLTVMAHGNEAGGIDVLKATVAALPGVDKQNQAVYLHLIYEAITTALRSALNHEIAAMQLEQPPLPPVFQRFIDHGVAKGRTEAQAAAIFTVLAHRQVGLSEAQREQIKRCNDPALLDEWLQQALRASCADELFV